MSRPETLRTRWAPEEPCPLPGYPRPHLVRPDWLNLNGPWEYAVTPLEQSAFPSPQGRILVPYAIESVLSGVQRPLLPDEHLWYRRTFEIPQGWLGKHILLHFGAVDWETEVLVNGQPVGSHRGGYLPFWFDITAQLRPGANELVVAVRDPTDTGWQARGKQVLQPKSIWYTAVSGIWQTVWLEPVPEAFITGLKLTPDLDSGTLRLQVRTHGEPGTVHVCAYDAGVLVAQATAESAASELTLQFPNPKLWSPSDPHLYDLTVETGQDRVESYFAMRKFSLGHDSLGRARLCLNDNPLFQFGPLDQGYWPDGLYTPPSESAMLFDLDAIQRLGCNMLRKHIKVEPARYYYECDRRGIIVWQDMPNGAKPVGDVPSFLAILFGSRRRDRNYRYAGREDAEGRADYLRELQEMVEALYNFPCIAMWVPFNEGWGQFDARDIAGWLKELDPTRLIDHASGWYDQGAGDCRSLHVYFKALPHDRPEKQRALVLSEFGGYALRFEGHLWNPSAEFGYRKFASTAELTTAYLTLLENELKPWIKAGLSAAIYTQTTDVEIELNGYLTYDRQVEKLDFAQVREKHLGLINGS